MFRRLSECLVVSLLWLPLSVSASVINELSVLVEQGKSKQAYLLSLEHIETFEGDPAFDLQYGTAAIDSGEVSEGVFALERVLFLEPNNAIATLELARGYYLLGQYKKAELLFKQVQRLDPPITVQNRIQKYLSIIDKKTSIPPTKFNNFIELWAGYDSNINSGPGDQTTVVTLSDTALGRSDPYQQLRVGANIDHAYRPDRSLMFGMNADLRYYESEDEQNYRNISFNAGHLWKNDNEQYLLNFVLQNYNLDNDDYRTLSGISGVWSKQLSNNSLMKLFAGVNSLSYDTQAWKDAKQINVGANYLLAGEGNWSPLYFAGAFIGVEDPESPGILADGQVDRVFYGGNLGVQLTPFKDLNITPALTYQVSQYAGVDWIYNIKRKDDFAMFNLNLEWVLKPSWTLLANYSFTKAGSNIELYDYDREQVMLGMRYNFK